MRLFLIIYFLFIFLTPGKVFALSCISHSAEEIIQDSDIIFEGVAAKDKKIRFKKEKSGPDSYTQFKIKNVYKGDIDETVDIYHGKAGSWSANYEKGKDYVVFANRNLDSGHYIAGPCSPKLQTEKLESNDPQARLLEGNARRWATLEMHKGKLDALDAMIERYPNNVWLYLQKGEVLEEFGDYYRAVPVYKTALEKEPNWHDVTSKTNFQKTHLAYGRALYHTKQYQEALPYLKEAADKELRTINYQATLKEKQGENYVEPDFERGAMKLYAATLINLGNNDELQKITADVSGMTFSDMSFVGLTLDNADFTRAELIRVEIENSSFKGADFNGATIKGSIKGSDFSNASFHNVNTNVSLEDTVLMSADFKGAELGGYSFKNADFSNANFEHATLKANHMKVPVENVNFSKAKLLDTRMYYMVGAGANYQGAFYNCESKFPDDFNPVDQGMVLLGEDCTATP